MVNVPSDPVVEPPEEDTAEESVLSLLFQYVQWLKRWPTDAMREVLSPRVRDSYKQWVLIILVVGVLPGVFCVLAVLGGVPLSWKDFGIALLLWAGGGVVYDEISHSKMKEKGKS